MTNIAGTAVDGTVRVEIEVEAPADAVFDFLVVPEKLLRWMGREAALDATPGGELRIDVNDDALAIGHFIEVVRPERVSFTWGWAGSELVPPGSSTVEVTLREVGPTTIVTLVHSGLPAGEDDRHVEGWLYHVARLADVVGAGVTGG